MARNLQNQLNQDMPDNFDDEEYAKQLQDELNQNFYNNNL